MSPRPSTAHVRRPAILGAAAEVISERGVSNTRISDVAERALGLRNDLLGDDQHVTVLWSQRSQSHREH